MAINDKLYFEFQIILIILVVEMLALKKQQKAFLRKHNQFWLESFNHKLLMRWIQKKMIERKRKKDS